MLVSFNDLEAETAFEVVEASHGPWSRAPSPTSPCWWRSAPEPSTAKTRWLRVCQDLIPLRSFAAQRLVKGSLDHGHQDGRASSKPVLLPSSRGQPTRRNRLLST